MKTLYTGCILGMLVLLMSCGSEKPNDTESVDTTTTQSAANPDKEAHALTPPAPDYPDMVLDAAFAKSLFSYGDGIRFYNATEQHRGAPIHIVACRYRGDCDYTNDPKGGFFFLRGGLNNGLTVKNEVTRAAAFMYTDNLDREDDKFSAAFSNDAINGLLTNSDGIQIKFVQVAGVRDGRDVRLPSLQIYPVKIADNRALIKGNSLVCTDPCPIACAQKENIKTVDCRLNTGHTPEPPVDSAHGAHAPAKN